MRNFNRFERGSGCYECKSCGKMTRETCGGNGSVGLCPFCFEVAGMENGLSDSGASYVAEFISTIRGLEKQYKRSYDFAGCWSWPEGVARPENRVIAGPSEAVVARKQEEARQRDAAKAEKKRAAAFALWCKASMQIENAMSNLRKMAEVSGDDSFKVLAREMNEFKNRAGVIGVAAVRAANAQAVAA